MRRYWIMALVGLSLIVTFPFVAFETILYFYGEVKIRENLVVSENSEIYSDSFFIILILIVLGLVIFLVSRKLKASKPAAVFLFALPIILYVWHLSRLLDQSALTAGLYSKVIKNDNMRVQRLLSIGADPNRIFTKNQTNKERNTPLMYAAGNGNENTVRILLNAGAIKTTLNKENESAADFARKYGHADLARKLEGP